MHEIYVRLLQVPEVVQDGSKVTFPYQKSEGLFLYLAAEKKATRDMLSSLFWENGSEESARKNLRNAIYVCKQAFGCDVIATSRKTELSLNPSVTVKTDLDEYMETGDPELYHGFLPGFNVKNAPAFDEWLSRKRNIMDAAYQTGLLDRIQKLSSDDLPELERLCALYAEIDPLDERTARALMSAYNEKGLYRKGISLYQKLCRNLNEELGIAPGQELSELYHGMRSEWVRHSSDDYEEEPEPTLPGRLQNYTEIDGIFSRVLGGSTEGVMLCGGHGTGKSHILKVFRAQAEEKVPAVFYGECSGQSMRIPLGSWESIMMQLDRYLRKHDLLQTLSPSCMRAVTSVFPSFGGIHDVRLEDQGMEGISCRAATSAIEEIFSVICAEGPAAVILDDLQYADIYSMRLAFLLVNSLPENFFLLCTCPDPVPENLKKTFLLPLEKDGRMTEIGVRAFTRDECENALKNESFGGQLTEEDIDQIYEQTGGNAFALNETIQLIQELGIEGALQKSTEHVLNLRLSGLPKEARQILDVLSLFDGGANMEVLYNVLNKSSMELLDSIEMLQEKKIITESMEGDRIMFSFVSGRMQEYIRNRLPLSRQRLLHNSIGYAIEKVPVRNRVRRYRLLIHHFSLASNEVKWLSYRIQYLYEMSVMQVELFPTAQDLFPVDISGNTDYVDFFNELDEKLETIRTHFVDEEEYHRVFCTLMVTEIRYYILTGAYQKGLTAMRLLKEDPYAQKTPSMLLDAYQQMVYYGIQTFRIDVMQEYLAKEREILDSQNMNFQDAIYQRHLGRMYILDKDYDSARQALKSSLEIMSHFRFNKKPCAVNSTAVYNYLGEICRRSQEYEKALDYYDRAMAQCTENGLSQVPYVQCNRALALFEAGRTQEAFDAFHHAYHSYRDDSLSLMGRSVCFAFMALDAGRKGQDDLALRLLAEASGAGGRLQSPYEQAFVVLIESILVNRKPEIYASAAGKESGPLLQRAEGLFERTKLPEEFRKLCGLTRIAEGTC